MNPIDEMNPGDEFYAIVVKGPRSKLMLTGDEGASQKLGPFTAFLITHMAVETKDWRYVYTDFSIIKANNEKESEIRK